MSLSELVGSSLILGIRGCTMNEDTTRADVDVLRGTQCRGVILFDHDIAGSHHRNILSPDQLERFIADLRHELGADLIVAIDQEGGRVSRLSQERGFLPSVSAIEFASWERMDQDQYATQHAKQLASLGIDLNLAPCVDLAIEEHSPIIAEKERAFGVDHDTVVACASIIIDRHRDAGVASCIKHYPGHGSSLIDTHHGMCDITDTHTRDEQRVFETLIAHYGDTIGVMAGHLIHRSIDQRLPASLSPAHLTGILRDGIGFTGPILCDSLDMRAIRDRFGEGEAAAMALMAGCDLIIDGFNAPGYRAPGGAGRIADAIGAAIASGNWADGEQSLTESRARVDRLLGRE